MKPAFIQYQNLGRQLRNNDFTIYSDNGLALPSGLNSDQLLAGSIVQLPDDATKVFVTPNIYDVVANGNVPNLSGLKFKKVNDTPIFIPGSNNYSLTQRLTGSNSSNYEFGTDSLKISSLGNILTVSSTKSFSTPRTALFIFTGVSGSSWALIQSIPHPSGLTSNPAGYSSDLTQNGSVICTTSWGINGSPGYAFIYTGNPTNGWVLKQTITGLSGNCGFGRQISTNNIGNIIAVAENNNDNPSLNKIYVYTGSSTQGVWGLKTTLTHPDLNALGPIAFQQNIFGNILVAGIPNKSGALVFRGTPSTGWGFLTKLSGSDLDASSVSINSFGNTIILGNPHGSNGSGNIKIYTGGSSTAWSLKQTITGANFQSKFGNSVSIKETAIVVGAPGDVTLGDNGVGRIYIYTGSTTGTWSLSRSSTGTSSPSTELGRQVDIYKDTVVASAPKLSGFGAINIYNPTSFTNVETYSSEKNIYAIWKNPVMNNWMLTTSNQVGQSLTSPQFFYNSSGSYANGTGTYTGTNIGSLIISKINNKLHVYNTPGISGFAGTYSSGVFTIAGTPRVGFRNDQNPNFYIYKNNLPSAWRAAEELYNGPFTWYSATGRQGVDEDPGQFPPVVGWRLGDNSVMNPPPVTDAALPLPEMNFGHCAGNTLIYPIYVYQANSSDYSIDNIKFYSGGLLSSSGTSELFSSTLSDMFPDLYNTYFDKQFFYTNIKNNNRFLLFKSYILSNSEVIDSWYIVESPSSYMGSGYYYWTSQNDYTIGNRNNYYNSARKMFKPHGNNINNLQDISIDTNVLYSNAKSPYKKDFNLQNFSGELVIKSSGNSYINDVYKLTKINGGKYNDLTGISGSYYIFASPKFNVSGAVCGNQAFTLNPSSATLISGQVRVQFIRATEGFQFAVQFKTSLLSQTWNTTGVTLTPSLNQSGVPSGFIREEFYAPAIGSLFFRMSGTTATWKILDSQYNYIGMRNCQPNSNILPHDFWFTGDWNSNSTRSNDYEIIPVYKHNNLIDGRKMLKLDSQYNYSQVSGIFNLNTGQSFVFQFFNEQTITGVIVEKSGGNIFGYTKNNSMFDIITNNGVTRMSIDNKSKNLTYYVFRSGNSSSVSKLSYGLRNIHCFTE
jgi:hypothetical protein